MPAAHDPAVQRRRAARKGRGFLMLLIAALILTLAIAALPLLSHV
jgi:hypothetical protein